MVDLNKVSPAEAEILLAEWLITSGTIDRMIADVAKTED